MKKTIFIDIDGVFHDFSDDLFRYSPPFIELLANRSVELVVHSTWRENMPFQKILDSFPKALRPLIVGATEGGGRVDSIRRYIESKRISRFIVLDDAIDGFPAEWIADGTLILCFPNVGVSEPRVLDAVRKFLDS